MEIKKIHLGQLIQLRVEELEIDIQRIEKFFKTSEQAIVQMYTQPSLDTDVLLKWSKLLQYDFFRIYCQHLILFAPFSEQNNKKNQQSQLPVYKKNLYTKELIDFVLTQINTGKKTKSEVIIDYRIPKTTLYKWINKYKKI